MRPVLFTRHLHFVEMECIHLTVLEMQQIIIGGKTNLSLKNIKLLPNQYQGREKTFNTDNIFLGSGTEPTQVPRVTITGVYNHSFNAQGA